MPFFMEKQEDMHMDYLGKNIPKLGFGLMRLPMLGEEVDIRADRRTMVDRFLDGGFHLF